MPEAAKRKQKKEMTVGDKGKPPWVKEDWVDPFVRSQVGWKADREERLLVRLLKTEKEGTPVSALTRSEARPLPKLEKLRRIKIKAHRVGLTKLGETMARGAKKLYPEFWSPDSLPVTITREGKWFIARCPVMDIVTQGKTKKEAIENIADLIEERLSDTGTIRPKNRP